MHVRRDGHILEARVAWCEGVRGYMRPRLVAGDRLVDPPGEGIELLDADAEVRAELIEAGYIVAGGELALEEV
jgi:hypothetical protein